MSCQIQTNADKNASWSLLSQAKEADQIDQSQKLIQASSLLRNDQELKLADQASVWFVKSNQDYFKVVSRDQLVPENSEAVRSAESDQLLRINAVVGG